MDVSEVLNRVWFLSVFLFFNLSVFVFLFLICLARLHSCARETNERTWGSEAAAAWEEGGVRWWVKREGATDWRGGVCVCAGETSLSVGGPRPRTHVAAAVRAVHPSVGSSAVRRGREGAGGFSCPRSSVIKYRCLYFCSVLLRKRNWWAWTPDVSKDRRGILPPIKTIYLSFKISAIDDFSNA